MRLILFGLVVTMFSVYTLESLAASSSTGQAIYEKYCITCHQDGLAGAPKYRAAADWAPRLTNSTLDDLVERAIKGINAMPAKGTCNECSDDDIKQAIQYMLPQS